MSDCDLFVIGGGSGGVRAARMAAGYGAKVILAEMDRLGGTCVNVGCIPKKLMVYAAHFRDAFEDARSYGWSVGDSTFDWPGFIERKDREIERLNGIYAKILDNAGVTRKSGRARVTGPHEVRVGDERFTAEHILVATGSWPRPLDIEGAELAITSNELFHLPRLPGRILIVGGGYIAVEFAGVLHGMGSHVTQIYRGSLFLRGFDDDVRVHLAAHMRARGIDLRFERDITRIARSGGALVVTMTDGEEMAVDAVLLAVGRLPRSADLGLEAAGVALDTHGAVIVDDLSRTSVPSIYAVGDITNRINLTPVALAEGAAVAATLFGKGPVHPDHESVPSAVFSHPEIGSVGLTEAAARARHGEIDIYRSTFRPLFHTLTARPERALTKLVVDRASQRVLGCHVVAPHASEIVQGFAVAIKMGATKAQLDATIGIHPTVAEELVTIRTPTAPS